jgi:hypothetical protein
MVGGTALLGNVSLTGCLGGGSANYTSWLFDPSEVAEIGDVAYGAMYLSWQNLPENMGYYDDFSGEAIFISDYMANSFSSNIFMFSSSADMEEELDIQNQDVQGDYQGYELYEDYNTLAVNRDENVAITADNMGIIEAIVDTHNGGSQPYTQSSEELGLAAQVVGGGDAVFLGEVDTITNNIQRAIDELGIPADIVSEIQAGGASFDFDDEMTDVQFTSSAIFSTEGEAENRESEVRSEIESIISRNRYLPPQVSSPSVDNVAQNGRSVLVTGSAVYNSEDDTGDSDGEQVEQNARAGVNVDVDNTEDTVTISLTTLGNSDYVIVRGAEGFSTSGGVFSDGITSGNVLYMGQTGATVTLESTSFTPGSGTLTVVAVIGDAPQTFEVGDENDAAAIASSEPPESSTQTTVQTVDYDF